MSRKSRYEEKKEIYEPTKWRAGAYIRLSREDKKKVESNSLSIFNQKRLINSFLEEHPDIELVDYYVDDGWTGTDLQRPEFQRLQRMYESGAINCIIIKDLSRLARNNEETGRLLRVIFPFFKIRFISINDRLDSFTRPESMEELEVSFKSIMHDEYSRENSRKIKTACDLKRRQGLVLGKAPYGYKNDPADKNHLIVDEEISWVIEYIFDRFLETQTYSKIAKELSEKHVLAPYAYKKSKGISYYSPSGYRDVWTTSTIKWILTNDVYIGNVTQGKSRNISYKVQKKVEVPKEEWITVEGKHEAIISKEKFLQVQNLIELKPKGKWRKGKGSIFTGHLICGHCGRALSTTKRSRTAKALYCRGIYDGSQCLYGKRQHLEIVEEAVLETLNSYLTLHHEIQGFIQKSKTLNCNTDKVQNKGIQEKISEGEKKKAELYLALKEGDISKEDYIYEKERVEVQLAVLREEQKRGKTQKIVRRGTEIINDEFWTNFGKRKAIKRLSGEMIENLIGKIEVYSEGRVVVHFKFADEFKKMMQDLEMD